MQLQLMNPAVESYKLSLTIASRELYSALEAFMSRNPNDEDGGPLSGLYLKYFLNKRPCK